MNTLQLAKLETQLGFKLKAVNSIEAILDDNATKSYLCNEQDEIIGLNLHYCGLSDLSAILPFKNLIALNISGNSLNSLEGIGGLLNLSHLRAGYNKFNDISAISPLNYLKYLDLEAIEAISLPLDNIIQLEHLAVTIDATFIKDLTSIAKQTNLKYLRLEYVKLVNPRWVSGYDYSELGSLENLEVLIIAGPRELSFIAKFKKLRKIKLYNIKGIGDELEALDDLEYISFFQCTLKSTDFLRNKKKLSHLELNLCRVHYIEDLKNASTQRYVQLEPLSCKINSLDDLKGLSELKHLSLRTNSIKDIQPLEQLSNLVYLDLSSNPIVDINCLASLHQLEILSLANTNITDISALRELKHLTALDLSGNDNIIDYSPIKPFSQFKYLGIRHEDYQPALSEELRNEFYTNLDRALDIQNYALCIDLLYKFKYAGGRGDDAYDIYSAIRENRHVDEDDKYKDKIDFWDTMVEIISGYTSIIYRIWTDYDRFHE